MCIDFSIQHPNLIAAGFYDGTVNVYDLKDLNKTKAKFQVTSKEHRHKEPVWQVRLVNLSTQGQPTNLIRSLFSK